MAISRIRESMIVFPAAALLACGGDLGLPSPSGEGVAFTIVDGNGQRGTVGEELPRQLVVSVETGGAPAPDHVVAFAVVSGPSGMRLDPDTAFTGEDGHAATQVVLGTATGSYEVEAKLVVSEPEPPPTAVFEGVAVAAEPDTLRATSPTTQPGQRLEPVAEPPTVVVLDRFGNPVPGAPVHWQVTAGGGGVIGQLTADAEGKASAEWTLGNGAGVQKLTARVEGAQGSPVGFTAAILF
jgi:hypothetical protein